MSRLFGDLGQAAPAATTLATLYTVPAGRRAVVKIEACNLGAAAELRISHAVAGAADAGVQYFIYDFPLGAGESKKTDGRSMNAGDVLRVWSDTGDVSFHANGIEETA